MGNFINPEVFEKNLLTAAKKANKNIVLPEGEDDRVITAASKLGKDEVGKVTIIGKPTHIEARVKALNLDWNADRIQIIDHITSDKLEDYSATLAELRKAKGLTLDQAKELMLDATYFGTMMVYKGDADGMVSGALNTTAHTIRPALQFIKTKPGISTVSSVFFMLLQDRVLVFGDCAIVPNPTAEQLKDIAISSAETAKSFGIEPRVAMLSYSSGDSGAGPDVDLVKEAMPLIKEANSSLAVEGPIQYDAAVDPTVGKLKMPNSEVAGQANVLIFPNLTAGNISYKAVQRETGTLAIGPVLQGLKKPINDLSRGANVDDIYNTVVITGIQAGNE